MSIHPARHVTWTLATFFLSIAAVTILTAISSNGFSSERFDAAIKTAFSSHQLDYDKTTSDQFTECALLTMEHLRPESVAENAVNTRFAHDYRFHPCEVLHHLVFGNPQNVELEGVNRPGHQANYVSYPFGARHLAGLALSVMELSTYRWLLGILAAISILSLTVGAAYSDLRKALLYVAPITATLISGFSLHVMGTNFAHGPDCWIAFLMLAGFLAFSNFFRLLYRRIAFAVCLGVVVTFLDMFDGAAPIAVTLLIFFNQVFYGPSSWRAVIAEAAILALATFGAATAYTALRLSILAGVFGIDWQSFIIGITARAGMDVGGTRGLITIPDMFIQLWNNRSFMVWGSQTASTVLLVSSGVAWCCAAGAIILRWRYLDRALLTNFAIAVLCSIAALCWFVIFPNHTYVHAHFMVRVLIVPAALGFTALLSLLPSLAG